MMTAGGAGRCCKRLLGVTRLPTMSFTLRNASQVKTGPGLHPAASEFDKCVGDALEIQAFGLYQVELPAGAETVCHDHTDDGAEDAYAVLRGIGVVVVDDREVPVGPGDFIAVTPDSTRYVRAGTDGLIFIAMCAPPGSLDQHGEP
jgi:mannose-6-phosphate isomerase-like protein (cupin superfamily)